jgi:hypothetical protein
MKHTGFIFFLLAQTFSQSQLNACKSQRVSEKILAWTFMVKQR